MRTATASEGQGLARRGWARQGTARLGRAGQGKARIFEVRTSQVESVGSGMCPGSA